MWRRRTDRKLYDRTRNRILQSLLVGAIKMDSDNDGDIARKNLLDEIHGI